MKTFRILEKNDEMGIKWRFSHNWTGCEHKLSDHLERMNLQPGWMYKLGKGQAKWKTGKAKPSTGSP